MRKNFGYIFFAVLFLITACSYAQEFTASVSKNPVALNDQFELTFTVNASGSGFQAPSFKDFMVLSGPNQSTSMQFINGSMSQSVSLSYYLQPKAEGTFRIDGAIINVNGKRLQSNSVTVTVVKGASKPQAGNNQQQQQQGDENDLSLISKNVFIKAIPSKSSVLRGEPLTVTFKLYTRVNILNVTTSKLPSFNGFWNQELKAPEQLEQHSENLNGINYRVATIKSMILFPQQSGTLTIDQMEGECIARVQMKNKKQNDPFGGMFSDPFFGDPFGMSVRDVKVPVKSEPVKINVKELPPTNDATFHGSVGKFTMEASLDKNNVRSNDAVNLKIKISGKGNIKLVEAPDVNTPPDIEKYDPQVNENISATASGVTGTKTFTYVLIPRHQGNYSLDPVQFSFFDLDKKQYVKLQSGAFKLDVEKGKDETSGGAAVMVQNKSDFKLIGKDILFIKTTQVPPSLTVNLYGSFKYYLLLILPLFVVIGAVVFKKRIEQLNSNPLLVRKRNANKVAHKHLASAKKLLAQKKNDLFYEEVYRGICLYSANKLSIDQAELNKEKLAESLHAKNVKEETIQKLISTLDSCEFARFASVQSGINPDSVYNDAVTIITTLEDEIV